MIGQLTQSRNAFNIAALTVATSVGAAGCAASISTQEEIQMGQDYATEINQQLPIVEDAEINRYLNEIGQNMAGLADDREVPYRFYLVDSEQINAFAIPGGHIWVNRGLVELTDNLSELAGVLGHEIAHVTERHGIEQMARMQRTELAVLLPYILTGRDPGTAEQIGIQLGGAAFFASHSRGAEREADDLGVEFTRRAGISPEGLPTFFQKLLDEQQRRPSAVEGWFATHPFPDDRVEATQAMIEQIPAAERRELTTDTPEYQAFRQRVSQLPPSPDPPQQEQQRR